MKRPPFKLRTDRAAQSRRPDGSMLRSGRSTFIYETYVLLPIACGTAPQGIDIRIGPGHPWHRIDLTHDEAYAIVREKCRTGLVRQAESHRRRRGLPVIERSAR